MRHTFIEKSIAGKTWNFAKLYVFKNDIAIPDNDVQNSRKSVIFLLSVEIDIISKEILQSLKEVFLRPINVIRKNGVV